jgi:hypothetical protein
MVWYGMARGLMTAPQLGRGRRQAGGAEAGVAEAGAAEAEAASEAPGAAGAVKAEVMAAVGGGARGVAGQERESVATSDRQQPRGLA